MTSVTQAVSTGVSKEELKELAASIDEAKRINVPSLAYSYYAQA